MNWLKQFGQAIQYIEDSLEKDIDYEKVAQIAGCSSSYFQRLFSYIVGISVSEYIRRRRMTQAAFDLQNGDKVIDTAYKYCYASPSSFHRAFRQVHGIAPTKSRNKGVVLNAYMPIKLSVAISGGESMKYQILQKQEFKVIGYKKKLTDDMELNQNIVPKFWQEILAKKVNSLLELSSCEPKGLLGITKLNHDHGFDYYIGVPSNQLIDEKDLFEIIIPKATWVVFESHGRFKESVQTIFRRFLMEWLPFSGYQYAELPDIEVYPIPKGDRSEGFIQVWIAIKEE
ncbi:MAG: AraC family transcriptional regulator [Tissierellia bacterium]|nr:AraC family transcriptional regulator [Tissierellia bacterium]